MFQTYALGWDVPDYGGAKIVSHCGAVFGFQTIVVLIRKNVGFAMKINTEESELLRGLTNELLDHYLGKPTQDWSRGLHRLQAEAACSMAASMVGAKEARAGGDRSVTAARGAMPAIMPTAGTARSLISQSERMGCASISRNPRA